MYLLGSEEGEGSHISGPAPQPRTPGATPSTPARKLAARRLSHPWQCGGFSSLQRWDSPAEALKPHLCSGRAPPHRGCARGRDRGTDAPAALPDGSSLRACAPCRRLETEESTHRQRPWRAAGRGSPRVRGQASRSDTASSSPMRWMADSRQEVAATSAPRGS